MHKESYKGYEIESTPNKLANIQKNKPYQFAIHGFIYLHSNNYTDVIDDQKLNIPDDEWNHLTEQDADNTFAKYAKMYIDEMRDAKSSK